MFETVIQDKTMICLVLVVAFFVGGAITETFLDNEVEAKPNITNTEIIEDFGIALYDISSDGEERDEEHEGKSCPFKNKTKSVGNDLNV